MSVNSYELISAQAENNLKYFFFSYGNNAIIKAVEYTFVSTLGNRNIFNLAFGDYSIEENKIDDMSDSNNGDPYKVFNTVLSTIPDFFTRYPNDIIMVTGSDSKKEYLEKCFESCKKVCIDQDNCKNKDRRINLYVRHVSKNHKDLVPHYAFFGGVKTQRGIEIVAYNADNKYDAVFVIKKP